MKTLIGLLFGFFGATLFISARQISHDTTRMARSGRGSLTGPVPAGAVRIAGVGGGFSQPSGCQTERALGTTCYRLASALAHTELLTLTPRCRPLSNASLFADADSDQTASDFTAWSGSSIGRGIPDRVPPRVVAARNCGTSRRRTSWHGAVLRRSVCRSNRRTGQFCAAILEQSEGALASAFPHRRHTVSPAFFSLPRSRVMNEWQKAESDLAASNDGYWVFAVVARRLVSGDRGRCNR